MDDSGVASAYRGFVSYIDRTREFYAAQGYDRPYRWARFREVPFAPLARPLSDCRAALVTTASPFPGPEPRDGVLRGDKQVWSGPAVEPPGRLFTADLAWEAIGEKSCVSGTSDDYRFSQLPTA